MYQKPINGAAEGSKQHTFEAARLKHQWQHDTTPQHRRQENRGDPTPRAELPLKECVKQSEHDRQYRPQHHEEDPNLQEPPEDGAIGTSAGGHRNHEEGQGHGYEQRDSQSDGQGPGSTELRAHHPLDGAQCAKHQPKLLSHSEI